MERIIDFQDAFLLYLETHHNDVIVKLAEGKFTDDLTSALTKAAAEVSRSFE